MKAIGYQQAHALDSDLSLQDIELPMPSPTARDLLVKIAAISVNPVDTKIRKNASAAEGEYKVLGWDAVGEVVEVGASCELFKVGDKVWYAGDLTRSGTNAEYQLVDERIVGHQPASLSDAEAAAFPLTAITAWELLFDRLGFSNRGAKKGSGQGTVTAKKPSLLIIGAAGGVGSILTQLAAKLTDATVIGTASRPQSQAWVKQNGADHVIDHSKDIAAELAAVGIKEVTHVIGLTHSDQHFDKIVEVLAPQGKFALIDDPDSALIDIKKLKMKSISLHWEFMYTRSMFQTDDMQAQHELLDELSALVDQGEIKTTLGENLGRINAQNIIRAHQQLEGSAAIGKIVLEGF